MKMFHVKEDFIYFYETKVDIEFLKRIREDIITKYFELENFYLENISSDEAKKKLMKSKSIIHNIEVEKVLNKEDCYDISYSKIIYPKTIELIDRVLNGEITSYDEILSIKNSSLPGKEYFDSIIRCIIITDASRKKIKNPEEFLNILVNEVNDKKLKEAAITLKKKLYNSYNKDTKEKK